MTELIPRASVPLGPTAISVWKAWRDLPSAPPITVVARAPLGTMYEWRTAPGVDSAERRLVRLTHSGLTFHEVNADEEDALFQLLVAGRLRIFRRYAGCAAAPDDPILDPLEILHTDDRVPLPIR